MNTQAFKINKEDLIQYFVRQENGEIIDQRTESGFRNHRSVISVVTNHYHKRPRIFKLNMFCAEKNLKKDLTITIVKQSEQ